MEQCCAAPASDSLRSLYILWLQRQSEVMPGKFETVEQVKQYELQWNLLYETSTSDLGEKVCRCMYIGVQNDRWWHCFMYLLAAKETQPVAES